MYSRKYIRSALPEASRRELFPSATIPGKSGREPSPPPDYTGTAFADPDALRQRNRQDFPEAVIPPREATLSDDSERETDSPPLSEEADSPSFSEEVPKTDLPPSAEEEFPFSYGDMTECKDDARSEPIPDDPTPSENTNAPSEDDPLLTLDLLRSLTLEDLMLYWMLLMLLTCKEEDQVYLLLGLLLLNR